MKDNRCVNYGYWCLRPKVSQTRTETDEQLTVVETSVYEKVNRCSLFLTRCAASKATECPQYEEA